MLLPLMIIIHIIFLCEEHIVQSQLLWVCYSYHWNPFLSLVLPVQGFFLPHMSCFIQGFVALASCSLLCHPTLSVRHLCMLWSPPPPPHQYLYLPPPTSPFPYSMRVLVFHMDRPFIRFISWLFFSKIELFIFFSNWNPNR